MRHMESYPTYPQNVSRLPVRILNDLVSTNRLDPLPIDGDSAIGIKRQLGRILNEKLPLPRNQKEWNRHAHSYNPTGLAGKGY
jgi:hypothetical protein